MTRIKYDFQIKGVHDWKRVEVARSRLWESKEVEDITYDYNDMLDGGQINYFLLYEPAAAIRVAAWYGTDEYLIGNSPLEVICEKTKHPQVKKALEELLKTSLVKRTKKNTKFRTGPDPAEIKAAIFAEVLRVKY